MKKLVAITLSVTLLVSSITSAFAAPPESINHNPIAGENGYVSLHSYVSPTNIPNVYKVDQTIEGRIDPVAKPVDIVLVFDNTFSMAGNRIASSKAAAKQMMDMFFNPTDPDYTGVPEAVNIALVQYGARGEPGSAPIPGADWDHRIPYASNIIGPPNISIGASDRTTTTASTRPDVTPGFMGYEDLAAIKTAIDANTATGAFDSVHAGLFLARDILYKARQTPGYIRDQKIIILNDGMAGESFPAVGGTLVAGPGANGVTTPKYSLSAIEDALFDYRKVMNAPNWEEALYPEISPGAFTPSSFVWYQGDPNPAVNEGALDYTINGNSYTSNANSEHNGFHAIATIGEAKLCRKDGIGIYGIGLGLYFTAPPSTYYAPTKDVMIEICDPGKFMLVPDSASFPNTALTTAFKDIVAVIMGELSDGQVDVYTEIPSVLSFYYYPGKPALEWTTTSKDPALVQSASLSAKKNIRWEMSHVPGDGILTLTYYIYIDPAKVKEGVFYSIFEDQSYITFVDATSNKNQIVKYFPKPYVSVDGDIKIDDLKPPVISVDPTETPKTDGLIPLFVTSNSMANPTVYTPSVTPAKEIINEQLQEGTGETAPKTGENNTALLVFMLAGLLIVATAIIINRKKYNQNSNQN